MFVLLVLMAFTLYAPAVLLPVVHEYSAQLAEERRLAERVASAATQVERARKMVDAFENDPIVNERLAQLDLKYQRAGEEIVSLPVERDVSLPADWPAPRAEPADDPVVPPQWPEWTRHAEAWARDSGVLRVYMNPAVRGVLLLMAAGLLIAAFVLYPPMLRRPRVERG